MDDRFAALRDSDPTEAQNRIDTRIVAEAAFLASGDNAKNHARLLAARADHNAWDALPDIPTPTLVFAGRYDQQAPLTGAENIANAMPDAALHIIEGGHSICFATPEPVATLLQHWTN
ncbi:hypothetical protein [Phaeobacter sp. J2-8]|uniref:alpha/beta fold hydrolase n=1 Tax=Phaeobacter sp. J2-8 TaxID=2931394 RepID=UPI001FD12CAD|nr:hypothetical protein [Phaeobacter sp. J2-8]MCJ7873445.1 hypothetical protein [Phaeobacter sp. J2-8]